LKLDMCRHPNDNRDGDTMVDWSHAAENAPKGSGVTLYDRFGFTAYIADVRVGKSISRPASLKTLAKIKANAKLPTGEKVERVMLVVPSRKDAVALEPLVRAGRVDGVVYPSKDEDGNKLFFDPNALGESRFVPFAE
jgi:hypothetical protein